MQDKLYLIMYCKAITSDGTICINTALNCKNHCKMHDKIYESCCVCLDNIYHKIHLKCGHEFCSDCIFDWGKTCPICRREILDEILFNRKKKYNSDLQFISNQIHIFNNTFDNDKINSVHCIIQRVLLNHDLLRNKHLHVTIYNKMHELQDKGLHCKGYLKYFESILEKYCFNTNT